MLGHFLFLMAVDSHVDSHPLVVGLQDSIHLVSCFHLQSGKDVAVGVHGQGDLAVAQYLHHHSRLHTL